MRKGRPSLDRDSDRPRGAWRPWRARRSRLRTGARAETSAGAAVIARVRGAWPAFLFALLIGVLQGTLAFAHASLVRSEPVEGAVAAQPPEVLKLIFNEPVAPLVMR